MLSRRIQPILHSLISETQSTFVPKRAISDNVLITHEVLHYLKNSRAEKHLSMAIKTDMSKAYDRLEWDFIRLVLERMNFHPTFTSWIMQCLTTVSYTFIINGVTRGFVKPGRGIRQGDPLSPYLFILCSEVLTGLCKSAHAKGLMKGVTIASQCPSLNHLLFADDTMFFCRANKKNAESLKALINTYEIDPGKRKVSWISWDKMARPKKDGGLGFKDVTSFNDALLAKIGWRIIKNPNCLLARCLLGKYCHSEMLMNCQASSASSHGWRSVLVGRDLLKQQLGWMVGSGESISVWNDPWLSNSEQMRPYGPAPEALQLLKVSDLIQQDTYEWDTGKIDQLIPFHKEKILKVKPNILRGDDSLVWLKNSTGEYSTRSGYLTITQEKAANLPQNPTTPTDWLPSVWNIKTAEKIKVFLRKSLQCVLPVGEQFAIRNIPVSPLCTRCNAVETVNHLLFQCPYAEKVWTLASLASDINTLVFGDFKEGWERVRRVPSQPPAGIRPGPIFTDAAWNASSGIA